jgi:sulfur carrier protein
MILLNGCDCPAALNKTLADYLNQNGYDVRLIAVEMNGSIIKKCDYATTVIHNNDSIEIVNFVGGG